MKPRLLLLLVGLILLITLPCNVPSGRVPSQQLPPGTATVEATCASQPPASDASLRWYDGSTLVYVPAGTFPMGIQGGEDNPLHTIQLDDFWIYQTEVTNGMYGLCVAAGGCTAPSPDPNLPDYQAADLVDRPVVGVTWEQANTFCKWMDARLPTEAEWEKTARGTDGRTYAWGEDQPDCDRANFNNCVGTLADVINYPTGASPYKALNMSGNASEWVSDWYKETYYKESPAANPQGPDTGQVRSVRGGQFASAADAVRTTTRASEDPLKFRADLGFRCVVQDAHCFAPSCEIDPTITRLPRTPPGESSCEPPPVNVSVVPYCQRKLPYANLDPNGATLAFQQGTKCNPAGDLYVCTGSDQASIQVKACTSCVPPTPVVAAPAELPSCAPGYQFDQATCSCKFVGRPGALSTECPTIFSMLYVPEQRCCQPQAQPSRPNLSVPSRPPGLMVVDCSTESKPPVAPEPVVKCEIVTFNLLDCTPENPSGCVKKACPPRTTWDAQQCCCFNTTLKKCQ